MSNTFTDSLYNVPKCFYKMIVYEFKFRANGIHVQSGNPKIARTAAMTVAHASLKVQKNEKIALVTLDLDENDLVKSH